MRVLTRRGHAPLLDLMEFAEAVHGMPVRPARALYAFDPLSKTAMRSFFTPALRKRCLLPEERECRWHARVVYSELLIPGLGEEYIAEYFWRHTPVPSTGPFLPPSLSLPPDSWKPASAPSGPFVLVNPAAGWPKKSWLPERWVEVLRDAATAGGPPPVICSGSQRWQQEHAGSIALGVGAGCRLAGPTSLREFLWLCSRATHVLTVDGAASHLASAFGIPCLTLFGPTNRAHWHFPTPGALSLQADPSPDGIRRMRNLPAAPVAGAVRTLLSVPTMELPARRLDAGGLRGHS